MLRLMKTCKLLPHTPLWERLAPPYTIMGETLRQIFIWPQSPNGWQASSKDFFEMLLLSFHVKLDDEHHLTTKTMGNMKSSFWCMPMERYLTTHRNATHTYHGLVHKAIWTIAYHTTRYIIPLGTSCSFVCWSQAWSTLYLFFFLHMMMSWR